MLKVLLFSLSIFVGLVAFNNCSGVKFEEATDVASVGDSTGLDAGVPPTVNEAINNCQQAISKGKILEVTKSIRFDDTKVESGRANVCEFNVGDNLGMVNGGMQARYEQQRSISLPTNAVLCDVSLSSPVQNFRYDDVFILTFNNRILASNNRSAIRARLTPERVITKNHSVDIYDYDWLALRGGELSQWGRRLLFRAK